MSSSFHILENKFYGTVLSMFSSNLYPGKLGRQPTLHRISTGFVTFLIWRLCFPCATVPLASDISGRKRVFMRLIHNQDLSSVQNTHLRI